MPLEIVAEKLSRALRNASYQNIAIAVDSIFESGKQRVVGPTMDAVKESRLDVCVRIFFLRDLLKTVEQRVHDDDISAETVNARGQDKIESRSAEEEVAPAEKAVCREPADEFKKMWPRQTGDSMPEDCSGLFGALRIGRANGKIFDTLSVQMNLAMVALRQSLEHLCKRAFGAMTPIHER